ncbi:MAG TPA: CarD family transcriptional regulator [Actinomycetaceae bacterium]|nr:CarD family transcriptional regulator [Actinomycetaceae bacterium]
MKFSEGQVIVHPHHGPATVTAITTRVIRDEPRQYLRLEVVGSDLVVGVPVAGAEEVGVRPVLGPHALCDVLVLAVLAAPLSQEDAGWSRRIKANVERLRTGDVTTVAGLVRDLMRRQEDTGLSLGEKDFLRDAKAPLVTEVAVVLGVDEPAAEATIDAAVLDGVVPTELAAAG